METAIDWKKTIRRLEQLLRLKSFPVGLKLLTRKEDLEQIPFVRRCEKPVTLCQLITRVRTFDWTVGAVADDFLFATCPSIIGLADVPPTHRDGTFRSIVWVQTKAEGRRFEAAIPRIPTGRYAAVAMAPQVYNPFEPDMILIYANPAQMMLLINALQFEAYEVLNFYCVGESSCSDALARCWQTRKPSLAIPCYGERRYGHAQDDELVMALPPESLTRALRGLEVLYRRGVRYPISFAGAEESIEATFPLPYKRLDSFIEKVRGNDQRLVVAVTGSIACGKSAVSEMLLELGCPLIDFDQLARQVVAPGTAGYDQIVGYFGRQVLQADGLLDRKALSQIVFRDFEKRKKLESFTHPYIYELFFQQVNELATQNAGAIIQVAVPLLIELNMQYLFDKVIVVYLSSEEMVKRLAARDGLSPENAATLIASQLAPDQKVGFADYVIDNNGTREQTRAQVEKVWKVLQADQQQRKHP